MRRGYYGNNFEKKNFEKLGFMSMIYDVGKKTEGESVR